MLVSTSDAIYVHQLHYGLIFTSLLSFFNHFTDHEPDLPVISLQFPVPNNPMTREIQIVLETIKQGPRARMPVHWAGEALPPPAEAPAAAAAAAPPVAENDVAKAAAQGTQALDSASNFAGAAATTKNAASATAATANPEMLNYLRSLNQTQETTAPRNTQDDGFAAGFIAATRFFHNKNNNSMNGMLSNAYAQSGPTPLASHSSLLAGPSVATLGIGMNLSLLQAHLANRGQNIMGGRGFAAANLAAANPAARQSQNRALTLEELQAYKAGLLQPGIWHQGGGR